MNKQFLYSSIFNELTKQTQLRFDAASALNKQLFDQVLYRPFLRWGTPSIGLNFSEVIGKYHLTISAATIDINSKEPVRVPVGLETLDHTVFKHSHTYSYPIQEYRKILQILDSRSIDDNQRKNQLVEIMWGGVADAVNGVEAVIDKIFLGALSNEGIFTFNSTNNPEGGIKTTIDFKMPSANKAAVAVGTEWIDANVTTADPLGDIQQVYNAALGITNIAEIWMSQEKFWWLCRNSKLKLAVFGNDRQSTPLTPAGVNAFLQSNGLPTIRVIRRNMLIQGQDGTLTPYTPWNPKYVIFVPAGELGVIENAYTDSELRPEPGVTYSNYGRIRVSQWGVGEVQASNGVEFTKAETLALPAFTAINAIFSLKVEA
jgi:hypothetical protein